VAVAVAVAARQLRTMVAVFWREEGPRAEHRDRLVDLTWYVGEGCLSRSVSQLESTESMESVRVSPVRVVVPDRSRC